MKDLATSQPVDLYQRITEYNDYYVVCSQHGADIAQCFMTTNESLAIEARNKFIAYHIDETWRYAAAHDVVASYWCDIRKRFVPVEYVCYDLKFNSIIPMTDITCVELFIASLAMETKGFVENNVMDHDDATKFREYFDQASRMHEGEMDSVSIVTDEDRYVVFRCVSPGPKILEQRCKLSKK